jgi:hypothetical protein
MCETRERRTSRTWVERQVKLAGRGRPVRRRRPRAKPEFGEKPLGALGSLSRVEPSHGTAASTTSVDVSAEDMLDEPSPSAPAEDERGGHLLVAPLAKSSHWEGRSGEVWVSRTGLTVKLGSRTLGGCVETVERVRSGGVTSEQTMVFCPGAGILSIEQQQLDGTREREVALLRSCDDSTSASW